MFICVFSDNKESNATLADNEVQTAPIKTVARADFGIEG